MPRIAVLLLCLVGLASAGDDPQRDEIVSKLNNTKVSLDFRETPLVDVMDFVREMSGINILIDPKVYDDVDPEKLNITVKVDDLQLGSALRLLLGLRDLTAVYREGVLIVVTKASMLEEVYTQIYDVHDLLQPITDFVGPVIELNTGEESEGGADPGSFIIEPANPPPSPSRLVEMVQDACGAENWGSDKVSIQVSNGVMIVSQSRDVQRQIAVFLNRLRETR